MRQPGWFNDEHDPALARWFDGERWTEHTLVKATWTGDGPPPPPTAAPAVVAPVVVIQAEPAAPEGDGGLWAGADDPSIRTLVPPALLHEPSDRFPVPPEPSPEPSPAPAPAPTAAPLEPAPALAWSPPVGPDGPPSSSPDADLAWDPDLGTDDAMYVGYDRSGDPGAVRYEQHGRHDFYGVDADFDASGTYFGAYDRPTDDDEDDLFRRRGPVDPTTAFQSTDRARGTRLVVLVGALLVVALAALFLTRSSGDAADDAGSDDTEAAVAVGGSIEDAVAAARDGLGLVVTDATLASLVEGLCAGPSEVPAVAEDAALSVEEATQLGPLLTAAARGAVVRCPDESDRAAGLVGEVLAAAAPLVAAEAASSTTLDPDDEADAGGGSSASGGTGRTSTTKATTQGSVTRTETRQQSSTQPDLPSGGTSKDQSDVGNSGTKKDETSLTIKPTTTTTTAAPPTSTGESTTTTTTA